DPRVIAGFFRAYWIDNRELADRDVIGDVVRAAGHDDARVFEAMGSAAIKDELRRRTDRAIELGVFGAPTWIVDGVHLYWGQDRMGFVAGERASAPSAPQGGARSDGEARTLEVFWDFSSPFAY